MRGEVRRDIAIGLMTTILLLFVGEVAVRTHVRSTRHRVLRPEWQAPEGHGERTRAARQAPGQHS